MKVVNLAQPGGTISSASEQLEGINDSQSLAIIEIGGNDLFNGLSTADFTAQLDRLLANAAQRTNSTMMFELPVYPTKSGYGAAQRSLAKKYNCLLIPKRCMARVLGAPGMRSDGLHLSAPGHVMFADMVFGLLALQPRD